MVIDFTKAEKSVLFRFMGLYVGSLFILFAIIAYLFYTLGYSYHLDERRHALQMQAHTLSSKIIFAHMHAQKLDLNQLAKKSGYKIAYYNDQSRFIAGETIENVDLNNSFSIDGQSVKIVDKSSFGHLGVEYIVLEDDRFGMEVVKLQRQILLFLFVSYIIILLVGYLLAKLFIKPIQMRRKQLDNFIKESTHELNTPVSALLMSVDARSAKKTLLDKHDERIKISAKRISDIYRDLTYLFLRNVDVQQKESIDMVSLLKEQVESLKPLAQKKHIVFSQKYHNALFFEIDHESAVRLITNLLSNAIKYNKRGGHIEICVKAREMMIKDSGIGISKEAQKEIFNRFYRATDQSGGFGLGLHIVSNICQKYGIKIEVESQKDKGTTFKLYF